MSSLFFVGIMVVALVVVVIGIGRTRNSKPPETEATLLSKRQEGDLYLFTFETKGGQKILHTKEPYYYNRSDAGDTGMLAYRGKNLIDFERYHKR